MWRYKVVELSFKMGNEINLSKDLDLFGTKGWELVCMKWMDCEIMYGRKKIICTFKQRKYSAR